MSDEETPEGLLDSAIQDFRAALSFVDVDPKYIKDHIFCGHLQGSVEKLVKSVLKDNGVPYPHHHDLRNLFGILGAHGRKVPSEFAQLTSLTIYATKARYGVQVTSEAIDRVWWLNLVREFAIWLIPDFES